MAEAYSKVNRFCESFLKWTLYVMIGSYTLSALFAIAAVELLYLIGHRHFDTKNLFLPLQMKYFVVDSMTDCSIDSIVFPFPLDCPSIRKQSADICLR